MKPGIYYDLSWSDYCKIDAISNGVFRSGAKSMKRLRRVMNGDHAPSRSTTIIGSIVHTMVSKEFDDRYRIMPAFENDRRNVTNGYQEIKTRPSKVYLKDGTTLSAHGKNWKELCEKHGKTVDFDGEIVTGRVTGRRPSPGNKRTDWYKDVSEDWKERNLGPYMESISNAEYRTARTIYDSILNEPEAKELIKKSSLEVSIIAEIEGILFKTRLDGVWNDGSVWGWWDLKTIPDISERAVFRHYISMRYDLQLQFHRMMFRAHDIEPQQCDLIVAEHQHDFDAAVVGPVPLFALDNLDSKMETIMFQLKEAIRTDTWPGVSRGQKMLLKYENWAMDDDEDVDWEQEQQRQKELDDSGNAPTDAAPF